MRIGVIGGVERNEALYHEIAQAAGHKLEFHGGHVGGRGAAALESLVDRSDLVVLVTDVNSHGAVQLARRAIRRTGARSLLLRRCGPARFAEIVHSLATDSSNAVAGNGAATARR